jgi:hypothetical protein
MKITVTQEHIDRARVADPNRAQCYVCPIAQALTDMGNFYVSVGVFDANWTTADGRRCVRVPLPESVTEWIQDFDRGQVAQPFSFDLDVT